MSEEEARCFTSEVLAGLHRHRAVELLTTSLSCFSLSSSDKRNVNLPLIVESLSLLLLDTSIACLSSTLSSLIRLDLLPNRLPIPSLIRLAKALPLERIVAFAITCEGSVIRSGWQRSDLLNAIANLAAFGVPKVAGWGSELKSTWARLLGELLSGMGQSINVVSPGHPPPPSKLLSHLELLASPSHLIALISPTATPAALTFVLSLVTFWPARRHYVLTVVSSKRGIIKDMWRSSIRNSFLRKKILESSRGATSVISSIQGWHSGGVSQRFLYLDSSSTWAKLRSDPSFILTPSMFYLRPQPLRSMVITPPSHIVTRPLDGPDR